MAANVEKPTSPFVGQVVVPGDVLLPLPETGQVRLGTGLRLDDGGANVCASRAGVLRQTRTGKLWIQGRQKRYTPGAEDVVIGVIAEKGGENYTVDINAAGRAVLPVLAFEGANRRNRPYLQVGDVVYCRVTRAQRHVDPQLACTDSLGRAHGFGQLQGGLCAACSCSLSRRLLSQPLPAVLAALGQAFKFELAVGLNGRVWVHAGSATHAVLIANALVQSEALSDEQAARLVAVLAAQVKAEEADA